MAMPVSPRDLKTALDRHLLGSLRSIALGLAVIFGILAVVNPLMPGGKPALMLGWELGILAGYLAIWWLVRAGAVPEPWAQPVGLVMALMPLSDTLMHTYFKHDPLETLGFTVLLFGVAFFFVSPPWFFGFLALALGAWTAVARAAIAPAMFDDLALIVIEAGLLAIVMFLVRVRAQRRLETLRMVAERRGEQLALQNAQLLEVDKLKSGFVSAVSHDLRTPLTAIQGYAEFLEDELGGPLTPQQRDYVAQIMLGSARLEHLVDDLLDFARIEAGTFQLRWEQVELATKAAEIARSLQPIVIEHAQELELELDGRDRAIWMDPNRIGQVLTNFLSNAIKFTPKGGRLALRVRYEGDLLRCEVQDGGPGIAEADLPRLFKRFSQLGPGREKGGTGLGLAISKAIVDAHGGEIGVRSRPGQGATFWFTLPDRPEPAGAILK
jgi:signal transduction histidine kinase